jgi:hypothetical protein
MCFLLLSALPCMHADLPTQAWECIAVQVMGMMQGKTVDDTFIVMDAFALPVEGTETRVNAQAEGYEYMVEFAQTSKQVRERAASLRFFLFGVSVNSLPYTHTHRSAA